MRFAIPQLAFASATIALAACASTPIPATTEAAAAQHDQVAARDDHAAAHQVEKYDPAARQTKMRCTGRAPGGEAEVEVCWTSEVNPTADHLKKAQRLHALAEEQRAASEKLRKAEVTACTGVSEIDKTMSPFSHPEDVSSVSPLKTAGASPRPEGALITFRAIDGMTSQRLEKLVNCQLARNACLENGASEMAYCPLVLKNVKASVSPGGDGLFVITVRSDDPAIAQEILKRSEALTVH
jgi:hypothetical protein